MLQQLFLNHPRSVNESYAEHFGVAGRFGFAMVTGGVACMIHALVPAWFERTGSKTVKRLYSEMASRQPGAPRPAHQQPEWQLEYEI